MLRGSAPGAGAGDSLGSFSRGRAVDEAVQGSQQGRRQVSSSGNIDPDADILAGRFGGLPSANIECFGNREFDFVSGRFVGQTTLSFNAVANPRNFLNRPRRAQIAATVEAAALTGRTPLFNFSAGTPHADVVSAIASAGRRFGVQPVITTIATTPR